MLRATMWWAVLVGLAASAGCVDPREDFGKTYYIDGAGNWGFGVAEVAQGLKAAGYRGHVEAYLWTTSFNPAIDQVNRPAAHLRAAILTQKIQDYLRNHPRNDVNIIALSAGTGIAVWAVEALESSYRVNNLVLLGSSLSSDYDMRKAVTKIKGHVYVYYSRYDTILDGPMRVLGTIDGRMDVDAAGLVGLHPRGGDRGKIVNIGWGPQYQRYGWTGAHTDCTSEPFVRRYIAAHVMSGAEAGPVPKARAASPSIPATSWADRRWELFSQADPFRDGERFGPTSEVN
ncbi:MAG TPA: hypothetical protein VMZ31_19400 [Phycisphaerae bacterium]|nr:hypothetical protein [Phycisphaerae bacterium]